jgi:hypothetical protein
MNTTGTYILKDKDHRYKQLTDQPWPVTEEVLKRLKEQRYIFQTAETDRQRAIFAKIE